MNATYLIIAAIFVLIASIFQPLFPQKFRNPANDYTESIGLPWAWCLLFGSFYFAARGIWTHAVVSLFAAILTLGISWLIYPFFAVAIVRRHYLRKGWVSV